MRSGLAAVAFFTLVALPGLPVRADDAAGGAFGNKPVSAAPIKDDVLSNVRGRFVAPSLPKPARPQIAQNTSPAHASAQPTEAGASPSQSSGTSGLGGRILYFGFDLRSAWTTHGPSGSTTYTAAENVGIDLSGARPAVSLQAWTTKDGASNGASSSSNGTVSGGFGDGRITGVAQTIQIAGSGNSVSNGATLDISSVRPTLVSASAPGSSCGAPCSVQTQPNATGVAIDLPGGSVSQGVGAGSLFQHVQVTSDGNTIVNQLKVALQVAPATSHAISAPFYLVPTTLQLAH